MVGAGGGESHQVDDRADADRAGLVVPEEAVVSGQVDLVVGGVEGDAVDVVAGKAFARRGSCGTRRGGSVGVRRR